MAQNKGKTAMTKTKQTVRPVPANIRDNVIEHLAGILYHMQDSHPLDVLDVIRQVCGQYNITSSQYRTFLKYNVEDEINARRVREEHAAFCDDAVMADELASITRWDDECEAHHKMWNSWLLEEEVKDSEGLREERPDEAQIRNRAQAKKERAQDLFDLESFLDNTNADVMTKYKRCVEMYSKYNKMLRSRTSAHSYTGLIDMQNCILNLIQEMGKSMPGHYMGTRDVTVILIDPAKAAKLKHWGFKTKEWTEDEVKQYGKRLDGVFRLVKTFFTPAHGNSKALQFCMTQVRQMRLNVQVTDWSMFVGNTFDEMREDVNWQEEIKLNFYQVAV